MESARGAWDRDDEHGYQPAKHHGGHNAQQPGRNAGLERTDFVGALQTMLADEGYEAQTVESGPLLATRPR